MERSLTVWTEAGVDRIRGVLDYSEDERGLSVRRSGHGGRRAAENPERRGRSLE